MVDQELMELASRVESATADQQRELLIEAFKAVHGSKPDRIPGGSPEWLAWLDLFNPFFKMLEARAFESAALKLVPEGCDVQVSLYFGRDGEGAAIVSRLKQIGLPKTFAATPALALCAAALRARASMEGAGR